MCKFINNTCGHYEKCSTEVKQKAFGKPCPEASALSLLRVLEKKAGKEMTTCHKRPSFPTLSVNSSEHH